MNEVLNCLKTRRSIRRFKNTQISAEELHAVVEAGTYAASGHGYQSAQIVAVQNAETIAELSALNAEIMGVKSDPYYGAPTILLVFADSNIPTFVEDGSCVLDNMMIAAHAVGLASCWIHREREMFERPEGKKLMKSWGLKDAMKGIGALALGYAGQEAPAAKPRKENYCIYVR